MASDRPSESIEDVLARCLHALEQRAVTLDQCLARFPEHAAELEPLLRAALALGEVPHHAMSSERVASLEQSVLAAARQSARRARQRTSRPKRAVSGVWRWAVALGIVLIVIAASGSGTVAAASSALPGEPLYGIKRTVEELQLTIAPEVRKPELLARFAEERLEEVEALAEEGNVPPEVIEGMVMSTQTALNALEDTSGAQRDELSEKLSGLTERQQSVLSDVIADAPPQAQPGLQRALEASQHGHERAIQAHSGEQQTGPPDHAGPPDGEGPPGQEGKDTGPPDHAGPPGQDDEDTVEDEALEATPTDEPRGQGAGPKCDSPPCAQGQGQGNNQGRGQGQGNNQNKDDE